MKNMKIRDTKKRTENKRIREGDYAKPGVTIQGEWTTFTFDAEKESQIPLETYIHISLLRFYRFIQCPFHTIRLTVCNRFGINQINIFILLHIAKQDCCLMCILRLCNQGMFQPSHATFNRILPFFLLHIEKICKNLYFRRLPLAVS